MRLHRLGYSAKEAASKQVFVGLLRNVAGVSSGAPLPPDLLLNPLTVRCTVG